MMKPKVALVKDGFLPPGSENVRGRLSGAAIARCKELSAQGWKIEGYEATASVSGAEPTVEKVKVATGTKEIADIGNPTRDERTTEAFAVHKGKTVSVGMRTVCNLCGSSLTYCWCEKPVVRVDFDATAMVDFKPRTSTPNSKVW